MKTTLKNGLLLAIVIVATLVTACKKKEDKTPEPSPTGSTTSNPTARLVIDNGARSIFVGKNIAYSAKLIKKDGTVLNLTSGVSWSSSNNNAGSFSGAIFTANAGEITTIKASYTLDGVTYSTEVPLAIEVANTSVFTVLPSAIIYEAGSQTLQLETIYIGNSSASYSFSSDNSGVANVSSSGVISFVSAGNAIITVSATINGQVNTLKVPVLVVGAPTVALPVAKVVVTPKNVELFKNETQQYIAKAYDSNGNDVSANYTFTWSVSPKDADEPTPVVINTTGMVSAKNIGKAYVNAIAGGISGEAELTVNPDTVILVTPFYVALGGVDPFTFLPGPSSQNLTVQTFKVDRNLYKNNQANYLTQITNPSNLNWTLPLTGIALVDTFYDLVTLSNTSSSGATITKKANAAGATFIIAHSPGSGILPGVSAITVMP